MINSDYVINEIDLSNLFDLNKHPVSFLDDHTEHISWYGSMIYTVWDSDDRFIYVGVGGVGKRKDPRSRINQHRNGGRSGDQFCVYIQDYFIIPDLLKKNHPKIQKGSLDKMTKDYIQKHLSYRFVTIKNIKRTELINVEEKIKRGVFGFPPSCLKWSPWLLVSRINYETPTHHPLNPSSFFLSVLSENGMFHHLL